MPDWNIEISRRTLLKGTALATGLAILGGIDGFLIEPRWLDITRRTIKSPDLPAGLEGFRVAHITDVHMSAFSMIHEELVASIDAFSPQLIVITGDMIDDPNHLADVEMLCDLLARPPRKIIATLGNWEHRAGVGIENMRDLYQRHDIDLLINEHRIIEAGVVVAGTDDGSTQRCDFSTTFQNMPDGELKLLLTHAPGVLDKYPEDAPDFDLTLCGHTHGGQITLFGFAPVVPTGSGSFISGDYTTGAGSTYISRGIGTSTIPVRFCCRPELALFVFNK